MRGVKKFSKGGRADAMRERRMADIEKDYQRALAKGKSEKEANAKRDQRIADAKDDYAKRTGADRTETRAAEKAAESRLTAARRSPDKDMKPLSVTTEGSKPLATAKVDMPKVKAPDLSTPAPKKAAPTPVRRAAAPAKKPTPAGKVPAPRYGANFGAPSAKKNKEANATPTKRKGSGTFAQNQQGFFDQLGEELMTPFRKIRAAGRADDKARGFAKGGKVDGAAIRGKTRAMRKK